MIEARARDWAELLVHLHTADVIPKQINQGGHFRSPYVFRGMSDSSWDLATSLQRLGSPVKVVEPALLRSFRKYAPQRTFAHDSDWEAVSVAQHNGLPTRVLDWTVSPLIAAHFATSERQHYPQDGVIWCINVLALRDQVLPPEIAQPMINASAAVFDVALLQAAYPDLVNFDETHAVHSDVCVFFEPPSIDARIANQTGILSAMNGPSLNHSKYFRDLAATFPHAVRRIIIEASAKHEIRDMLDQNNIHERMLFPGLPGLCDWLRRYYGPA